MKILDGFAVYAAAFVLFVFEVAPKILHIVVAFQFRIGLRILETVFLHLRKQIVEEHCGDSFVLVFLLHTYEQEINSVCLSENQHFETMEPSEREQASTAVLQRSGT